MKLCETCGNDIEDDAWRCPYCESPQRRADPKGRKRARRIVSINLKNGQPTVAEAIARLGRELDAAQRGGASLVKVIHGWGSSGEGGAIKAAARRFLRGKQGVREVVAGDNYSELSNRGRDLLSKHPELKKTLRSDRENPGITFVALS